MTQSHARAPQRGAWLPALLIVLLAFALRTVALFRLPLFVDESMHIYRAFRVVDGQVFIGLEHQKWLYTVVLALFRPYGPESAWLARSLSALCGAVTVAAAIALGRLLGRLAGSRLAVYAGLAAGLLYAVLPMTVFHERQALVDPLMATFTALSTLLMMRLARRPRLVLALLLAVTLAASYLTKASAVIYLALPFAAVVLLARRWDIFWRGLGLSTLSAAGAYGISRLVYSLAGQQGVVARDTHRISLQNTLLGHLSDSDARGALIYNLTNVSDALTQYLGYVVLALVGLAFVWLLRRRTAWREALFLAVPAVIFLIPLALFEQVTGRGYLPPRYVLPNALPLVTLAGFALARLVEALQRFGWGLTAAAGVVLAAASLFPALRFDAILIRDPASAPFTEVDQSQYFGNYYEVAAQEIAQALRGEWQSSGQHLGVLGPRNEIAAIRAYLGPRLGTYEDVSWQGMDVPDRLVYWLSLGDRVYVFDYADAPTAPASLDGAVVQDLGTYENLRLVRVTGLRGELADRLYARLAGQPDISPADGRALSALLAQNAASHPVVVFPASYAPTVAEFTGAVTVPFSPGVWPATPQNTREALHALGLAGDGTPLDLLIAAEERTDPARTVALAFQQTLYNTGTDTWAGAFHLRRFVTGPTNPPLPSAVATFEDAIHLSAALVDAAAQPGSPVRIAVEWRSDVPVQDSFKVFTHVVGEDGTLVAQYDAVPGDGLLPMTGWTPGEAVTDRFAILLPADLAPGDYELRIGLYDPASGLRLRVTAGSSAPDYAIIGRVTVSQAAGTGG